MPELAQAWVTLTANTKGMEGDIRRSLDRVDAAGAGRKAGKQFSDAAANETRGLGRKIGDLFDPSIQMSKVGKVAGTALKGALIGGVAGVGATIAGTVGAALFKGFERLKAIDDAKFKLKALGNSAGDVQKIMDSALASVKGTAFGFGDAATIAANAVAAGVKPGEELTKFLKMTADASAIAGTELSDMGRIINQVRTGQKAYTEDLNQLADRGIPIYQWLGEEAGVAAGEVKKLASEGGISAAMFEAAIQKHIGGAALTMGQSFSGSVQNAEAALSRLGAAFLGPVFGNAAGGVGSITTALDGVTNWITTHQGAIIDFWNTMGQLAITGAENFAHGVGGMLQALGDLIGGLGNVKGALDTGMEQFARLRGDDAAADAFHKSAQEAYGWGESIRAAGDKLTNLDLDGSRAKMNNWADAAHAAEGAAGGADRKVKDLGNSLGAIPANKNIAVDVDTARADEKMRQFIDQWSKAVVSPQVSVPGQSAPGSNPLQIFAPGGGGRATGGAIFGSGSATSDSIPAWLSHGEHVLTADEVERMGGQGAVYAFRNALHRQGGGFIPLRDPRGIDPHGGSDGQPSLGPFAPWWDMDWMPPENPEKVGPSIPGVEGKWWHRGPAGKGKFGGGSGPWAPPIGKWRPPLPGDPYAPWMLPDSRIKTWGFAGGGAVLPDGPGTYVATRDQIMSAVEFAKSVSGNPYKWGGTGPKLFDCSGFMSAIYGIVTGKPLPPGQRYFTTEADFTNLGFFKGFDPNSPFNIGVSRDPGGHMAGTLAGFNVESGGGHGVLFGAGAAGANDPQFGEQFHLPGSLSALSGSTSKAADTGAAITQHYAEGLNEGGQDAAQKLKDQSGSSAGGGGMDGSSLGQSIFSGILQGMGFDGSVFSNPFEWPNVKSGIALANFGGGLLQGVMARDQAALGGDQAAPSGGGGPSIGGLNLPNITDFIKPIGPGALTPNTAPPGTSASGIGAGPAPGPTIINNGTIGMDPRGLTQRMDTAQNQAWRRNMTSVRPGG